MYKLPLGGFPRSSGEILTFFLTCKEWNGKDTIFQWIEVSNFKEEPRILSEHLRFDQADAIYNQVKCKSLTMVSIKQ